MATVTPLSLLRVSAHQVPAHKLCPNTSIQNRPLLIYHHAFREFTTSSIESYLRQVGVVEPQWVYTMYSVSHFHSTTHELLCVAAGSAKCCFGHEDNPDRIEVVLDKGDVVVVPAGVAHRLLKDDGGFAMVGSYPVGKHWDMCYGQTGEEEKVRSISNLDWFKKDPIYGDRGPVLMYECREGLCRA